LVLLAFKGHPPTPQHQAAHADGCRQHNDIWNLRWATPQENAADRRRHNVIRNTARVAASARYRPGRSTRRGWRVAWAA
jgi:hypothetical protein